MLELEDLVTGEKIVDYEAKTINQSKQLQVTKHYNVVGLWWADKAKITKNPLYDLNHNESINTFSAFNIKKITLSPEKLEWTEKNCPVIQHIKQVICNNNPVRYEYLFNWMAHVVQRKGKAEVSVLLLGPQGAGKGTVVEYHLSKIIGNYYERLDLVAGSLQFSDAIARCCLAFIDKATSEVITPKIFQQLKKFITDHKLQMNGPHKKGKTKPN